MPWKHALRELALVVVTLGLWRADAALRGEPGLAPVAVAISAGIMAAVCGYLAHEWGHLLGAVASRSVVHLGSPLRAVFLFRFDPDRNGRAHFLAMSWGGFAASAVVIALYLAVLPPGALSTRIALGLVGLGLVATAVLEVPAAWRVHRGAPLPRGAAYASQPPPADHPDRDRPGAPSHP